MVVLQLLRCYAVGFTRARLPRLFERDFTLHLHCWLFGALRALRLVTVDFDLRCDFLLQLRLVAFDYRVGRYVAHTLIAPFTAQLRITHVDFARVARLILRTFVALITRCRVAHDFTIVG